MDDPKLITDASGTRVVISHDDPDYGPWRVCPVKPTGLRAALRVLAGRYEPQLTLQRSLTMRGFDRALKRVFDSSTLRAALDASPLFSPERDSPPS